MPILPLVISAGIKYGVPLVAYGIGHLVGWFHHKHAAAKAAK
jgi:hypothetical protein